MLMAAPSLTRSAPGTLRPALNREECTGYGKTPQREPERHTAAGPHRTFGYNSPVERVAEEALPEPALASFDPLRDGAPD